MLRAHRQAAVAQGFEVFADGALMHFNAELLLQDFLQIHPPPAHHSMHGRIGACFQQRDQGLPLCLAKRALVPAGPPLAKPANTLGIIVVNPIPERLPIHPAGLCCRASIRAFEHQRNRQHPPHDQRGLLLFRQLAKLPNRQIKPRNSNRS